MDHGTQEEDGPGTWEALAFLDSFRSHGESGDPLSDACVLADRAHGGEEKSPYRGRPLARETGAVADGARESEGCKVAVTSGNGGGTPDPAERRRPVLMRASGGNHDQRFDVG